MLNYAQLYNFCEDTQRTAEKKFLEDFIDFKTFSLHNPHFAHISTN